MKQESLRKLRHRILAGLLCCSILVAGQPGVNGGLRAAEGVEEPEWTEDALLSTEEEPLDASFDNSEMQAETENLSTEEPLENTDTEVLTEEAAELETEDEALETASTEALPEEAAEGIDEQLSLTGEALTDPQAEEVHQHSVSTDCSVSDGEQVEFTELTKDFTGGTLPAGNYYLSEDVALSSTLEISSGTVNLCLNGHKLIGAGTSSVIEIKGSGILHICDCGISGTITNGKRSGIYIFSGSLYMHGGTITGNTANSQGGGIYNSGFFELSGGSISGNTTLDGGGVFNASKGNFIMTGGTISNNTVVSKIDTDNPGGGGIYNEGTIQIKGGSISGNQAEDYGGGVYNGYQSHFEMSDGEIVGNSTTLGGGIFVASGTAQISGGKISNNTALEGGGIRNAARLSISGGTISENKATLGGGIENKATFILTGGTISNNTAISLGGGILNGRILDLSGNPVVKNNVHEEKINNIYETNNLQITYYINADLPSLTVAAPLTEGADIGITCKKGTIDGADVITDSPVVIPKTGVAGLDVSQYVSYFSSDEAGYSIQYQKDAAAGIAAGLYLGAAAHQHSMSVDCAVNEDAVTFDALPQDFTGGVLAEGNYYLSGDVTLDSTLEISSGTVNLCLNGHTLTGSGTGSVIKTGSDTVLYLCDCDRDKNGTITGGTDSGIYISSGTVYQYGGNISGNDAKWGGGIHNIDGSFFMYGGNISNNVSERGGGVYNIRGNMEMYGGRITNNTAELGGGVNITTGTFTLMDGEISNNTVYSSRTSAQGGGVFMEKHINEYTAFKMYGGRISNNIAKPSPKADGSRYLGLGGGLTMTDDSIFELWDGEISNNEASNGGGIYSFDTSGKILMNGGIISGNSVESIGGGVHTSSTFEMKGGSICGNTANSAGAICSTNSFRMSSGIISDNTAHTMGGIWATKQIYLSGTPVIQNNKNKRDNTETNLLILKNNSITIAAPLSNGADIGITYTESSPDIKIITDSPFAVPAYGGRDFDIEPYAQYFSSDIDGYGVLYRDTPQKGLYLSDGVTITYDYAANGGDSVTLASAFVKKNTDFALSPDAGHTVTAAKEGWEFAGWNTDPDAEEALDTIEIGTENVILYAIYKKTVTASFYSGADCQKTTKTVTLYNNKTAGTVTTPELTALPGWQTVGWDTKAAGYNGDIPQASALMLSEDTDYYGIYQQEVTLSYDANGGSSAPARETKQRYANVHNSITYQNPVFTLASAISRTGYVFDGWHRGSSTGAVSRPGTEVELNGNATFYADWIPESERSYVVEHYWQDVTGDGYTRIDTVPYRGTVGTRADAEARTYTGFSENTGHPSRTASGTIAEDGSLALRLYYDRDTYTISFDLNGGEGTPPEEQLVRYGGTVAPVAAPVRKGYGFTGWYTEEEMENRWDFTATVEENERHYVDSPSGIDGNGRISGRSSRAVPNRDIILYAGWSQETVTVPEAPIQPDTVDNNNNNTIVNNNVTINNPPADTSAPTSRPVPGTGDTAQLELYATAAMIAGLSYILLELAGERGMTEEKKRELTARLVQWARQGGMLRRILAVIAMFLLLAYYHSIGKQISVKPMQIVEK
ncbi:MAG: InlB B-repeat-containing protein [Bacteroides sp.]|nr:InlB B-repeat-containing protein [Bacteroides sp.]MCM1549317.1 InlB B-repeat-containing protein [Clostridium sp.]